MKYPIDVLGKSEVDSQWQYRRPVYCFLLLLFCSAVTLEAGQDKPLRRTAPSSGVRIHFSLVWKPAITTAASDEFIKISLRRLLASTGFTVTTAPEKESYNLEVVIESAEALDAAYIGRGTCYSGASVQGFVRLRGPSGPVSEEPFDNRIDPPTLAHFCGGRPEAVPFGRAVLSASLFAKLGQIFSSAFGDEVALLYWTAALNDHELQFDALFAMDVVKDPAIIPLLVNQLVPGSAALSARKALLQHGNRAIPELIAAFEQCLPSFSGACEPERQVCCVRSELADTLAQITGQHFGENKNDWLKWAQHQRLLSAP